jgi:copper transport protein
MMTRPANHPTLTSLIATLLATIVALAFGVGVAGAHNSLVSSNPSDGAILNTPPASVTLVFAKEAPLDTLTVTLIDATGVRTELTGSAHGPTGTSEVVTPLPPLTAGTISLRWQLVGPDGHPVTGRVNFTITDTVLQSPSTLPADPTPATLTTTPQATSAPDVSDDIDSDGGVASWLRWLTRYGSYAAIAAAVGILGVAQLIWSGATQHRVLRKVMSRSLIAVAVLSLLQLLIVASDISGSNLFSSAGSIDAAITTDAGMAFLIRVALAIGLWVLLFGMRIASPGVAWVATTLAGVALVATWAFAGHARSQRWPFVGVFADVAHHGAAAIWLAGLAIVGLVVLRGESPTVAADSVRRLSSVAAVCVAVLVVTGLVQSVRLVGSPLNLLDTTHGRLLAVKVVAVAVMLALANANRRRVARFADDDPIASIDAAVLRRAVVSEFAIGLVVLAVTAALVVSPPSSGQSLVRPSSDAGPSNEHVYYTV